MRTTIYAMLAVVLGITLMAYVPGQLTGTKLMTDDTQRVLQGEGNLTGSFSKTQTDPTTTPESGTENSEVPLTASNAVTTIYRDIGYYGLWGVNLIVALGIYLLAKRYLS